jgi:Uma2 family endonuclease
MASVVPPVGSYDNLEHYEHIGGQLIKKGLVGHIQRAQLERMALELLIPFTAELGGAVEHEWTLQHGEDKLIPDVMMSFPDYREDDGNLIAPAFLVVESAAQSQSISMLAQKCRDYYHSWGTPYCWLLDAQKQIAFECHLEHGGSLMEVDLLTAGPVVKIPVSNIFEPF